MSIASQTLFTEIFPVRVDALPQLSSYIVEVNGGETSSVGGKLAYRLKRTFPGHWAWAGWRIVTDFPQSDEAVMKVVEALWAEQPDIFRSLRRVYQARNWTPSAQTQADFVARGLLADEEKKIRQILDTQKQDLGSAYLERVYEVRGWDVQGKPAVSVSISSRLVFKQDVATYAKSVSPEALIGLQVADKTGTLKGEIVEIVGTLANARNRLLRITQREEMQSIISSAPDNELVVSVSTGSSHPYDYVVSALRVVLNTEDFKRFNIDGSKALSAMRFEPGRRAKLIGEISQQIGDTYLQRGYSSKDYPELFETTSFMTTVRVGNGKSVPYNEKTFLRALQTHGLFRKAQQFADGNPIKVGFLIDSTPGTSYTVFWEQIEGQLRVLGFDVQSVGAVTLRNGRRAELELALSNLENDLPDIVIAFFPGQFDDDENDDETAYNRFKSLTIGRGIPSQVIEKRTFKNKYAVGNIVMGILAKTGNIPYILAQPLEYADVLVGIDIARERKKRLQGSVNATAIARVYLNNGEFLQYVIHDMPLEGETIPTNVLQSLFPVNEFAGKRVVIHRDGYFRGREKEALKSWASEINATFHLVEVIKSGSPRVYAQAATGIQQPEKGSAFLLQETEALLVSTLPPFRDATPRPLRIRVDPPFSIEQALHSVLSMSILHYGSLRPPKLPVTIHYSDKIAYMALKGIKPKNLQGTVPYWL